MIIQIFGVLLFFSLSLIFLGFYIDNISLQISGFLFMFFLGMIFLTTTSETLTYKDGENHTLIGNNTIIEYEYKEYENNNYGFWIVVVSVFGFVTSFFNYKNSRGVLD